MLRRALLARCCTEQCAEVHWVQACAGPAGMSDMQCRLKDEIVHRGAAVAGVMQSAARQNNPWRSCEVQEYQGLLDDKDRWLHDAVLHGGKPAFTSQFDS